MVLARQGRTDLMWYSRPTVFESGLNKLLLVSSSLLALQVLTVAA